LSVEDKTVDPIITEGKEYKPLLSQLNDAQLRDVKKYAVLEEFNIDVDGTEKTFKRRKIKTRDYTLLEKMRAEHSKMPQSPEKAEKAVEILRKAAEFYLGMTSEEFDVADFEITKRILDAQNLRTLYGVPYSQTTS
jgi:hypothetical protein